MEDEAVRILTSGQVFFDYGPVSMVVTAKRGGMEDTELCRSAFPVVEACLGELRSGLAELRRYPPEVRPENLSGTALVMARAVMNTGDPLLTPMAAVAGSLSDAVADYLQTQGAEKAVANNGGDVAVRLGEGESLSLGIVYDILSTGVDQVVHLTAGKGIGGVATSGLGGRSLTTGIASGVTVFSKRCADADALATLLADRSYIPSPAVHTQLAGTIDPDSDIADLQVVTGLESLSGEEKTRALEQVMAEAELQFQTGSLLACIATVQGSTTFYDPKDLLK